MLNKESSIIQTSAPPGPRPQQPGPPWAVEPAAGMIFFLQSPCLFSVFTSGHEGHSLEASLFTATATCRLGGEVRAAGLAWDFLQTLLTFWSSCRQPGVPGLGQAGAAGTSPGHSWVSTFSLDACPEFSGAVPPAKPMLRSAEAGNAMSAIRQ